MGEKDPIEIQRDANALYDSGKYEEASQKFVEAANLYKKLGNFFDSSYAFYKAGECQFFMKKYEKAIEYFEKSAELAFEKSFDRFGVSALEYARDCYRQINDTEKVEELEKKIKELKEKLSTAF